MDRRGAGRNHLRAQPAERSSRILPGARIISGEAVSVDLAANRSRSASSGPPASSRWPSIISSLGTGSSDDLVAVPGLLEHGIPLKGPGEALALRNHVLRTLEQADAVTDNQLRERLLTFVIAGAGFAGVEMSAAIAEFLRRARDHYPVLRKHGYRMILAHGGEDIFRSSGRSSNGSPSMHRSSSRATASGSGGRYGWRASPQRGRSSMTERIYPPPP